MPETQNEEAVFDAYSQYYDLLYADKDYGSEAAYVADALQRLGAGSGRLIEFGCGTGKHAAELCSRGFEVVGVDRSPEMAQQASQRGIAGFSATTGDIRSVRVNEKFDAAISLFHVISYLRTNQDILAALQTASEHLNIGGVFLFDVWHGPAVLTLRPEVRARRMENDTTRVVRIAEPDLDLHNNRVTVNYTVFANQVGSESWSQLTESHPMRYLFPLEIDLFAERSGFEVVLCEAFETGEPASSDTWGVAYGLRKVSE